MREIFLNIHHPELEAISDQTFRILLKNISRVLRNLQRAEVNNIIHSSQLDENEKLELWSEVDKKIHGETSYYIDHLEKGSLLLVITVGAVSLWVLKITMGEVITEAWKRSDLRDKILRLLTTKIAKKKRIRDICVSFREMSFSGPFILKAIKVEEREDGNHVINLHLYTPEIDKWQLRKKDVKIDATYLINEIIEKVPAKVRY